MEYCFYPFSFDMIQIQEKFKSEASFLKCMVLYKQGFERFISSFIPFDKINAYIEEQNILIPKVDDLDVNFYHKFSAINCDYIFLRNNVHVENLNNSNILELNLSSSIPITFFEQTFKNVLFEAGDYTYFGRPCDATRALSQSLVFEFAFKQSECENLEQLYKIRQIRDHVFAMIDAAVQKNFPVATSYLTYNMNDNLFKKKSERNRG